MFPKSQSCSRTGKIDPCASGRALTQFHVITCMNVAIEAHVEENLREASHRGSKSLTVDELAKPTSIDPTKLGKPLASFYLLTFPPEH